MSTNPKAVVVTGAASGIGKATVEQFREDDEYDLVACLNVDNRVDDHYSAGEDAIPYQVHVSDTMLLRRDHGY